jgi:hypothetical protein
VEFAYLLFTLLCPLSMVALVGWWFWSMRATTGGSANAAPPARTAAEEGELARMRSQLDQSQQDQRDAHRQRA